MSFITMMQHPWQQEQIKKSVLQFSFFPLGDEKKFTGITVYKILPEAETTSEENEFREFLKDFVAAR